MRRRFMRAVQRVGNSLMQILPKTRSASSPAHQSVPGFGNLVGRRIRVAGNAVMISVSARARVRWGHRGLSAAELDQLRTVRLIIDPDRRTIKTVEHAERRRWRH